MLDKKHSDAIKKKNWDAMKQAVGMAAQSGKWNLDELLMNVRAVGLDSLVCQTEIQSEDDIKRYAEKGYYIQLTEAQFRQKFELDPKYIWYTPSVSTLCLYFNRETLAACPFHVEFLAEAVEEEDSLFSPKKAYKAIQEQEADAAKGNYWNSLLSLNDAMRLDYFKLLVREKGKEMPGLYEMFLEFYSQSDYGFSNLDRAMMDDIFASKSCREKKKTERKLTLALGPAETSDTVTVYRGGNTKSTPWEQAYSWTLDINTANFFAIRRGQGPAYIAEGKVRRSEILEYIDDRDEKEVLVKPGAVQMKEVQELKGLDFLEDKLPAVAPVYLKYKSELDKLDFFNESSIHGKQHTLRVLLLCLLIAEELGLPMADKKTLATAAIYHDTQRTHDWVEPEHGRAARDYYHEKAKNPDPVVEFLCEYHCAPDEEGMEEIRRNRHLRKNRSKAELLYRIFKDADGLDRVRLGDIRTEMDINQYRLDITKGLTLVARISLENIDD